MTRPATASRFCSSRPQERDQATRERNLALAAREQTQREAEDLVEAS